MKIFELIGLAERRVTVPVEECCVDRNLLRANKISEPLKEVLPVRPACVGPAIGFFEVEKKRQFAHVAAQQVDPQFRLLPWLRPTIVEPVGTPGNSSLFCAAPVVPEIGIHPQVLPCSNNDKIGGQVHPLEIDLLRGTGIILIKTYIGTNDSPRHSCLLD